MASNKLKFIRLKAKNFRSIGNMGLEIDYNASASTLIASVDNGSGKSNLAVWALYFALFGKPYAKDCKIGGLVNSKSGKDMLVELEFETLGSKWLVKRGYKPAIFEIWKDGKLIESEAAKKDYQAYLQSIIGMDEKAFENIVALGVERFVPFVQMKAEERRKFVERMLDLIVISQMNVVAKDKAKAIKKELDQLAYDIGILESKHAGRVRTRTILEQKKQQRLNETGAELDGFRAEETKIVGLMNKASDRISEEEAKRVPGVGVKIDRIKDMIRKFEAKRDEITRAAVSVEKLHDCPTCKQGVSEEHKSAIRAAAEVEAGKLAEPLEKLQNELKSSLALMEEQVALNAEILRLTNVKMQLEVKLQTVQTSIKNIEVKMVDSNEDAQIEAETKECETLAAEILVKNDAVKQLHKNEETVQQLLSVLKDEGIKANIVAQYIPFLNQQVNSILDRLNLYVQINIDSEFNVEMYAPNRKGQTLGNLSTGQLRRIDLAVLLAWREIAKNKASVDCNILILDEILENLSASGVEEFMEMWEIVGAETNLMVITQRAAEFDQYFDRTINYALRDELTIEV